MDSYTLLAKLVEFGAWPLLFFIVAFWLVDPVKALLIAFKIKFENSYSAKAYFPGGLGFELLESNKIMASKSEKFQRQELEQTHTPKVDVISQKIPEAKMVPVSVADTIVKSSWNDLERTATATVMMSTKMPEPISIVQVEKKLVESGRIDQDEAKVLHKLYTLRNTFSNVENGVTDVSSAYNYQDLTYALIDRIVSSSPEDKKKD